MTSFLEGPLAAAIAKGFNGKLLALTLRKATSSGRDSNGDPITSTVDYAAQGFPDGYSDFVRAAAGIPTTDTKIVLIAGLTAAEPSIGDQVQMRGDWYQIRNVNPDPAKATFECQAFRVQS